MRRVAIVVLVAGCGRLGFDADRDAAGMVGDAMADAVPDAVPDAAIAPNLVFVSSKVSSGNIGGLATADSICQDDATAAGLPGSFVAFIWNGGVDPTTRLAGATGWVDVTGRPIAADPGDFLSGRTIYPVQYDARGAIQHQVLAWQGDATHDCAQWTDGATAISDVANANSDETVLTQSYTSCNLTDYLLCLEHARAANITVPNQSGRIAFITQANWTPAGLASADMLCATEAAAAGLAGTYLAMLPTDSATAASRFDLGGPPWRRVDGVRLTQAAADWFSGPAYFDTFLARTAAGTPSTVRPWTGLGGAGTCTSWTSSTGSAGSGVSFSSARAAFDHLFDFTCVSATPITCLQI